MNLLNQLLDDQKWDEFLESKINNQYLDHYTKNKYETFIKQRAYYDIVQDVMKLQLPIPSVKMINKKNNKKKRKVFVFKEDFAMVLKMIAYLLHDYDDLFASNLYSFKKNVSSKDAIYDLIKYSKDCYSYKVDISDYFNSVDPKLMMNVLKKYLNDETLIAFFEILLVNDQVYLNEKLVTMNKGILAGCAISGFLANLYLKELDDYFALKQIAYARYSDDIIIFNQDQNKLNESIQDIHDYLKQVKLDINPSKEVYTKVGEAWEYLGFKVSNQQIDIASITLSKIKGKMKRKARALIRWKHQKKVRNEHAMKAFINKWNRKFYEASEHELTWSYYYFPILTTSESLKVIDRYMIDCIRYIASERHNKSNYQIKYEDIKKLGYKSLLNQYYKFKKQDA